MFETARPVAEIIAAEGLATLTDSKEIERVCREVIEKNPEKAAKFRAGNEGMFQFFVGQAMRATHGQADPQAIHQTLRRLLAS
jgi:aspartyl-tRNA(Asn)/glutamyl-tRNA(Gln) amidotransferase subunit B